MGLLEPLALAALPLLGVIIVLYLLRLRRPTAPVASLHLWSALTRDREANTLWQRLRFSLLLMLQLVVLLVLILSLARPWVPATAEVGQNVVIILDVSASMGATDAEGAGRRTRLQAAQDRAEDIVDNLPPGGTATLIATDRHATVLVPPTGDRSRLRAAIEGLRPQPAGTDMIEALQLAGAFAAGHPNTVVWVLSDGAFPPAGQLVEPLPAQIRFVPFGVGRPNQGITALSLQQNTGGLSLFVQIANSDIQTATRRVDLSVDDTPWSARTVSIPPGASTEMIVEDVPLGARVVQAKLAGPDALPIDDQAWVINRASVPANVLLVTSGNRFLELALSLLPTVNLYKVAPADYDPAITVEGAPVDLTVFDAGVPTSTLQTLPESNLLIFAPAASTSVVEVSGVISQPTPLISRSVLPAGPEGRQEGDPLLRFVDLSSLHIARAMHLQMPDWGRAVLSSEQGPLIIAGEQGGRKVCVIAFDLHDTDLPVQAAFPLLMRNLIAYLSPDPAGGLPVSVSPGTPVGIEPAGSNVDSILVEDPSGQEHHFPTGADRQRVTFGETSTPGVYYVTHYAGRQVVAQEAFAVNLFSRDESMITPNPSPDLPEAGDAVPATTGADAGRNPVQVRRELWPVVALIGLLLLVAEWLYAQRIVIRRWFTEMNTQRARRLQDRA
jgi:hypothetical protein